jgi:hypothetical protein
MGRSTRFYVFPMKGPEVLVTLEPLDDEAHFIDIDKVVAAEFLAKMPRFLAGGDTFDVRQKGTGEHYTIKIETVHFEYSLNGVAAYAVYSIA